jgi:ferritin-like metal-binding protein YciE
MLSPVVGKALRFPPMLARAPAHSVFRHYGWMFCTARSIPMKINSLHELYVEELRYLYNAETQLIKALPKMAEACSSPALRSALEQHVEVTRNHKNRLEQIFQDLDESPKGRKCKAMKGLIDEGSDAMELDGDPAVHDAAIIAAAQRVEHYEMAGYGTVRTFADLLGYSEAAQLLQATLDEEGQADKTLSSIAERDINQKAVAATGA